ncbi:MAG: hypothetical protein E7354_01855 [Clostridiales bacterium]|nr:hypothetical protein [Clostridiales bacterium]
MENKLLDCKYSYLNEKEINPEGLNLDTIRDASLDRTSLFVALMPDGEIDIAIPYKNMEHINKTGSYNGNIFFKKYHLVHSGIDAISDSVYYTLGNDYPPMLTFRGIIPLNKFARRNHEVRTANTSITTEDIKNMCRTYNQNHTCSYM